MRFYLRFLANRVENKNSNSQDLLDVIFRYNYCKINYPQYKSVPRMKEKPQTRSGLDPSGSRHFSTQYEICGI